MLLLCCSALPGPFPPSPLLLPFPHPPFLFSPFSFHSVSTLLPPFTCLFTSTLRTSIHVTQNHPIIPYYHIDHANGHRCHTTPLRVAFAESDAPPFPIARTPSESVLEPSQWATELMQTVCYDVSVSTEKETDADMMSDGRAQSERDLVSHKLELVMKIVVFFTSYQPLVTSMAERKL